MSGYLTGMSLMHREGIMVFFRQVGMIAWLVLAFMVTAAVVLNFRYKPLSTGAYLDTWTGELRGPAVEPAPAPQAQDRVRAQCAEIAGLVSPRVLVLEGERVRYAFPAPRSRARP